MRAQTLSWLEECLASTQPQPLPSNLNLDTALRNSNAYKHLEGDAAWLDYQAGLRQTRDFLTRQLTTPGGTVDKFGHPHDDEKRAVLEFVNILLLHTNKVHAKVDLLRKVRERADAQRERLAPTGGQIHGDDSIFGMDL